MKRTHRSVTFPPRIPEGVRGDHRVRGRARLRRETLAQTAGGKPPLVPTELDSWVAILPDGRVTAFFGKMDMGQSLDIAIAQIVADELDVDVAKVDVVMGDTALTCNQGGASGSTGIQTGARPLRSAAAKHAGCCCNRLRRNSGSGRAVARRRRRGKRCFRSREENELCRTDRRPPLPPSGRVEQADRQSHGHQGPGKAEVPF